MRFALIGRDERDHLFRARRISALQVAVRQTGKRRNILLILLQDGGIGLGSRLQVTRSERVLGSCEHTCEIRLGLLAEQPVDEGADRALGLRAHESIERLPVAEGIDRRQRLDAKLGGDCRVLISVDLHQADPATIAGDHFFENGCQLFTRAAPRRPEIHEHRHRAGGLEHVAGEPGGR